MCVCVCRCGAQKRRQQFALLFHVLDELQRVTDDGEDMAGGEEAGEAGGPTQMDVDN